MSSVKKEIGVEEISFYYDEMVRSHLVELEIETPQGKIILQRRSREKNAPHPLRRKTDFMVSSETVAPPPALPSAAVHVVSSPIMGIFFRSSSPQSESFVKENQTVEAGATLCIVEAMKVMNEIKAEKKCRIVKILAENGKPVTKGQTLFQVEPI